MTCFHAADVHKMLDAETYIDSEGNLCTTDGTILLRTGANPTAVLTAYAGGSFFWASDPQTVSRFDTAGGAVALHPADGTLEALTGSAMLIRREGAFYRVPYGEFTQPATPTPTASPTPLPTPDPERVEVAFSGTYLIVPAGTTAARLRDALAPADVEVYTKNMSAAAGKLKTDQIAMVDGDLYTVIVPGDLNASGTVNTADLRLFQRVLAGDAALDDAAAFAADLNGDGTADAADLVLLSARIAA
ncbi:MAG: dockerin type I domain-containing protein [Acutalibacteraceae bacterium]